MTNVYTLFTIRTDVAERLLADHPELKEYVGKHNLFADPGDWPEIDGDVLEVLEAAGHISQTTVHVDPEQVAENNATISAIVREHVLPSVVDELYNSSGVLDILRGSISANGGGK